MTNKERIDILKHNIDKVAREKFGSRNKFCEKTGVGRSVLSTWYNGKVNVSDKTIIGYCDALGVDILDMMKERL